MSYIKIAQKAKRYIKQAAIEHNIPEMLVGGLGGGLIGGVAGRTLGSKGRKRNLYTLLGALTGAGVGAYAGNQFGNYRAGLGRDFDASNEAIKAWEHYQKTKDDYDANKDQLQRVNHHLELGDSVTKTPVLEALSAMLSPKSRDYIINDRARKKIREDGYGAQLDDIASAQPGNTPFIY